MFVLPEPDGPIINILNGQLWSLFSFFKILYFNIIFDLIIPTDPFKYFRSNYFHRFFYHHYYLELFYLYSQCKHRVFHL